MIRPFLRDNPVLSVQSRYGILLLQAPSFWYKIGLVHALQLIKPTLTGLLTSVEFFYCRFVHGVCSYTLH